MKKIVLENEKSYIIVEEIVYNDKQYYYLINANDCFDNLVCEYNEKEIITINDKEKLSKLFEEFVKKIVIIYE